MGVDGLAFGGGQLGLRHQGLDAVVLARRHPPLQPLQAIAAQRDSVVRQRDLGPRAG